MAHNKDACTGGVMTGNVHIAQYMPQHSKHVNNNNNNNKILYIIINKKKLIIIIIIYFDIIK